VRRELDEYFAGRRREFDLPLDLRVAPFHEAVLHELARVPTGAPTRTARSRARSAAAAARASAR
jgi:methylated-DNA-[protein]-cysteine S-methyltransferase